MIVRNEKVGSYSRKLVPTFSFLDVFIPGMSVLTVYNTMCTFSENIHELKLLYNGLLVKFDSVSITIAWVTNRQTKQ